MVIVSSFHKTYNEETGFFSILPTEPCDCPLCGGGLVYRNSRRRNVKNLVGDVLSYLLRRLRCETCHKLHTELPSDIQPYRHYDSETIQSVIDGDKVMSNCIADDSTIRRWKRDFAEAEPDIAQRLASIYARQSGGTAPIKAGAAVLAGIRRAAGRWLAFVMELLINVGHQIRTRFAFCPAPLSGKVVENPTDGGKGGEKFDKTVNDGG